MGFWEVVLILVVAFLVVGPAKVPEVARAMGKGNRWLKRNYTDFKVAITKELDINEGNTSNSVDSTNNSVWNKKKD